MYAIEPGVIVVMPINAAFPRFPLGAQGLLLDLEIYASQPNNSGQAVKT